VRSLLATRLVKAKRKLSRMRLNKTRMV
jgi:hypothetical protein